MQLIIEIQGLSAIDQVKIVNKILHLCYQEDNEKHQLQQLGIGVQNLKPIDERTYACDWPADVIGVLFQLMLKTLPFHRFAYVPNMKHRTCFGHHRDTEWWFLPLGVAHMSKEHLSEYKTCLTR